MKKLLFLAVILAALIGIIGCYTNPPVFYHDGITSQESQQLYPSRPDAPGRLALFHTQPGGVSWIAFVYEGYRNTDELWNINEGRLVLQKNFLARIRVGPPFSKNYYTFGAVQLKSHQTYTVLYFPLSPFNELLDRPWSQTVYPNGRAQDYYEYWGVRTYCDVYIALPWVLVDRPNPFDVKIYFSPADYYPWR